MQSSLFILSAAVAAVSATHPLALPKLKRDLEEASQTDVEIAPSCSIAVLSLATAIPTPPPSLSTAALDGELQSYLASPCQVTLAASLSSDIQKYASEVETWYSSHADEVSSVLEQCSDLTSLLGGSLTETTPVCSSTASNSGRTTSGSASKTSSSGSASKTTDTASQSTPTSASAGSDQSASQTSASASASASTSKVPGSAGVKTSASIFAAVAAGVFAVVAL